jgi:ATP-dependent Lon protease
MRDRRSAGIIEKANLPDDILAKANEELDRLKKTPIRSPEFSVNTNYIEWLVQVPWRQSTQDNYDINHVNKF